ncbi:MULTISPECIES: ASCH domain-containing protein [unclassified Streptomyces]|uniref:ASCH domain-containing protein n=1 Tax=unclassified Streptomyces TaxID=2593676 RepID=UPI0009A4B9F3|nr:ASCH domain-containing protein [Streptomyces sp. 3211]
MDDAMYQPTEEDLEPAGCAERAAPAARQSLPFHHSYLDAVRTGRKTTTVRLRNAVETGPVDLVFELDDEVVLPGEVTRVISKRVGELTDADAVADGFRDLAELQERLRFHYPRIEATDDATIVHFRLTG